MRQEEKSHKRDIEQGKKTEASKQEKIRHRQRHQNKKKSDIDRDIETRD